MCNRADSLLSQAVAGDPEALQQLLIRHGPAVRRSIAGQIPAHLRPLISEDDVMQETYAEAFLDIRKFRPDSSGQLDGSGQFVEWLKKIAHNNLLDSVRELTALKRDGRYRRGCGTDGEPPALRLLEMLASNSTTPSAGAQRGEVQRIVARALEQLPRAYRDVVELYDIQLFSAAEVAQRQRCTPGAVYMRRHRAHLMLRNILEKFSDGL